MSEQQVGTGASAVEREATAEALEQHRRSAWSAIGSGAIVTGIMIAVLLAAVVADVDGLSSIVMATLALAVVLLGVGVGGLVNHRRMRAVLGSRAWVACVAFAIPSRLGNAKVLLRDPVSGELHLFTVVTTLQRLSLADPGPMGVLWWCGDFRRGGVISRPGGQGLVWVRPPRLKWGRNRLVWVAEERGVRTRLDPQPLPQGASWSSGRAVPETYAERTPKRRPVFRWVALLGVVLTGLGIAGFLASDRDPMVDLMVLADDSQGNCSVHWVDPWDGEERVGAFQCDPDPDRELGEVVFGWVVSYGPWKGDLYNYRLEGTPAHDVNDGLGIAGFGLIGVAVVGGGIRWGFRGGGRARASVSPPPVPTAPPGHTATPVSLVKEAVDEAPQPEDFTYAWLAELAVKESMPELGGKTPRPEADVRTVPWWQVRSLLRLSQLSTVAVGVSMAAAAILGALLSLPEEAPPMFILAGFGVVTVLVPGYRAFRGRHALRAMVQAARAPVAHPKRYVLLHDPYDITPTLIFFPAHGGPESLPEGALQLVLPGPPKDPGFGLPAPTGTAELRGWLDDVPTVVPWVEGRALWPQSGYEEFDLQSPRDLACLQHLVTGKDTAAAHDAGSTPEERAEQQG